MNSYSDGELGTIICEKDIAVLDELFFSVLWAILEGIFICGILIICDCAGIPKSGDYWVLWGVRSGVGIVVACNLMAVSLMC